MEKTLITLIITTLSFSLLARQTDIISSVEQVCSGRIYRPGPHPDIGFTG
ncbi:hypothetical protein B6N26_04835 (plasmid) [Salmonella enterica subsp. enterica]|nr:hypothetical protein B6N26_04835 [Salmonella enterica subsp. enterica]